MANRIAGKGSYSHEVPTVAGETVTIKDGHHEGTEVTLLDDGRFLFAELGYGARKCVFDICILVRGADQEAVSAVHKVYGCDLDSWDSLNLLGFIADDEIDLCGGTAVWDSRVF